MKVLAYKNKKIAKGILINILIYVLLLGIAIWRIIIDFNTSSIIKKIIFIGVIGVVLYLTIDLLITYIKELRKPKERLKIDDNYLYAWVRGKEEKILIEDIKEIKASANNDGRFLFLKSDIQIKGNNKAYTVTSIDKIDIVLDELDKLIKKGEEENNNEEDI